MILRGIRFAVASIAVVVTSFVGISLASAPANALAHQSVNILGGVLNGSPVGTVDPNTESSTDGGATWGPAYLVGTHPWGFASGTDSWINCGPSFDDCLNATSWYRYRFYYASDFQNPTMDALVKPDNYGTVYINGTRVSPSRFSGTWSTGGFIDISSYVHAGWNELTVELVDVGGMAGINYGLTLEVDSDFPIAVGRSVNYDSQGGSSVSSGTFITGQQFDLPTTDPTRDGYEFLGWFVDAETGTALGSTYTSNATRNITLYAHWSPLQYDVFYDEHDGSAVNDDVYTTGGTVTLPLANPVRAGYTFDGWFVESSGGSALGATYSPPSFGDITLHAQWTALPTYVVTFESNDGTGNSATQIEYEQTALDSNTFSRDGYIFTGWNREPDGTGEQFEEGDAYAFDADMTLYAQWTEVPPVIEVLAETGWGSFGLVSASALTITAGLAFVGWRRTRRHHHSR